MRRSWELLCLALGSLRRTPLRVALTVLGITIATGALVSMVGFALGIQAQVEEPFQRLELFNRIDVTPPPRQANAPSPSPEEGPPSMDDACLAQIARLPGVALAYPDFRLSTMQIDYRDISLKASAVGLPPEAGRLAFVREMLVAGRFMAPSSGQEVVLGRELAQKLGFAAPEDALGRTLTLKAKGLSPGAQKAFTFQERQIDVVVAGVWNPPAGRHGFAVDGLVLPSGLIRDLPGIEFESALERLLQGKSQRSGGYGRVVVRVERPSDLFVVEKRIQDMGLRTETLLGRLKEMHTAFVIMDLVLTAVGTVALVVAGLGIINTQLMAVLERYQEIGTFKALGASDGDIRLLFLTEAGLVGLLGGLGGLVLGRTVSLAIDLVVNAIARSKGVDQPIVAFAFPFYLLAGGVLFALVVSLLSGVYPAARAARVDPIRALRGE